MFTYLLLLGVVIGNMVAQLQACTQNRWKKIFVFSGTSAVISTTKFMIKKKKIKKRKAINVVHLGVGTIDYLKGLTGPASTGPNKTEICVRYAFPSRGEASL